MIPKELRDRLEAFVCSHQNQACRDEVCMLKAAEDWVHEMEIRGYPRREMVLLGLAYQAYLARDQLAKAKLTAYEAAISHQVAKRAAAPAATVLKLVP